MIANIFHFWKLFDQILKIESLVFQFVECVPGSLIRKWVRIPSYSNELGEDMEPKARVSDVSWNLKEPAVIFQP